MPHIKALLEANKTVTFKVSGVSMWPFYQHRKTDVTLKKKPFKRFDVVLASYQNRYVLHRIIRIKLDQITLKGDGAVLKEVIQKDDILGVVVSHQTKKRIKASSMTYKLKVILWVYNPFRRLLLRLRK